MAGDAILRQQVQSTWLAGLERLLFWKILGALQAQAWVPVKRSGQAGYLHPAGCIEDQAPNGIGLTGWT